MNSERSLVLFTRLGILHSLGVHGVLVFLMLRVAKAFREAAIAHAFTCGL